QLPEGLTLLGCQSIPPHGLFVVLRYAPAVLVHEAKPSLCSRGVLLHRQTIPAQRFRVVMGLVRRGIVQVPETHVGVDVTLLCREAQPSCSLSAILIGEGI